MTKTDDPVMNPPRSAVGRVLWGDAWAWQKESDSMPLRTLRWAAVVGLVIWWWIQNGTPHNVVSWLPVFVLGVLLLLPDAASITIGSVTWNARRSARQAEEAHRGAAQEADRAAQAETAAEAARTAAQSQLALPPKRPALSQRT